MGSILTLSGVAGPAAADGRLRVGDQLVEINSQSTKNMTHGEAIELIKTGGGTVRLLVRRGKPPHAAFLGSISLLYILERNCMILVADQAGLSPSSATPVPGSASGHHPGRPVSALSQPGPGPVSHSSPRYQYSTGGYTQQYAGQSGPQYWQYQQSVE